MDGVLLEDVHCLFAPLAFSELAQVQVSSGFPRGGDDTCGRE